MQSRSQGFAIPELVEGLRTLARDVPRTATGVAVEAGMDRGAPADVSPRRAGPSPSAGSARDTISSRLSPEQRGLFHHGVDAAETPILLVHGIVDNHSIFTVIERALRRRGFRTLSVYDYGLLTRDIRPGRRTPR